MRPARLVVAYDALPTYHYAGGIGSYMSPCPLAVSIIKSRTYMHACMHHVTSQTTTLSTLIQTYKQRRSTGAVMLGWMGGENYGVSVRALQNCGLLAHWPVVRTVVGVWPPTVEVVIIE